MSSAAPDPFALFFFADSSDLFVIFDVHGVIVHFNNAWKARPGFSSVTLLEHSIYNLIHFDDSEAFAVHLSECRNEMHGKTIDVQMRCADDTFVWYSCYVKFNPSNSLYYVQMHNIADQVIANQQMIQREERLKILVENVNEYLYSVQYRNGAFVDTFHNRQCEKITGYTVEEFKHQPDLWYTMIHQDDRQLVIDNLEAIKKNKKSFYIEHRIIHKSGEIRWISNSCIAVVNEYEQKFQYIGFILDITEKKSKEYELYDHATRDALTGIYNRWAGIKALNRSISKANRSGLPCTICYLDINNLKETNDRFGHAMGDELIKNTVRIIQHELRNSDIFFRMGGDEFVLIFTSTSHDDAQNIVQRIINATETFNTQEQYQFRIFISFGFSHYIPQKSDTYITAEQLIEEADRSMYFSKQKSRGIFRSVMTE